VSVRALIACSMLLAACGPSIGLKSDYQQYVFEIGRTTRDQVIASLGLPQKIVKDSEGRDHFIYDKSAQEVGVCCHGVTPHYLTSVSHKSDEEMFGAEYVFDSGGFLFGKIEPAKKQ
jgi:hypothetical protein